MVQIIPEDENDLRQVRQDTDLSATESLKLERNSRGYNWAIRIVRKDGETDQEMIDRLTFLNHAMHVKFS